MPVVIRLHRLSVKLEKPVVHRWLVAAPVEGPVVVAAEIVLEDRHLFSVKASQSVMTMGRETRSL